MTKNKENRYLSPKAEMVTLNLEEALLAQSVRPTNISDWLYDDLEPDEDETF